MAWDQTLPDGSLSIAQGDDDIRANNVALEAALDLEHRFATGGNQSGRHKFVRASSATIAALSDAVDGSIAFDTSIRPTPVLRVYDGSNWLFADVGTGDVPRLDEANSYTADSSQNFIWDQITPVAGSPDTVAVDLTRSGTKYVTITGDSEISNPTGAVANHAQNVLLAVTNSGAGHALTWGTNYRSAHGITPLFDDSDGALNLFSLTVLQSGNIFVNSAISIGTF